MILMTTDEDDVILDPFAGSGTAAVATMQLGRKYIGVDIDPEYFEATHENCEKRNRFSKTMYIYPFT